MVGLVVCGIVKLAEDPGCMITNPVAPPGVTVDLTDDADAPAKVPSTKPEIIRLGYRLPKPTRPLPST
jgi:hypothetical protein